MAGSTRLKGVEAMQAKLRRLQERLPDAVGRALYQEAQIERTESMRRTPFELGTLRASHRVTPPRYEGRKVTVTITVGGAAAAYAIYVHEDLDAYHPYGRSKFLESTLKESAPYMAARIARRIRLGDLIA